MFFKELKRAIMNKQFFILSIVTIILFLSSSYDTVWRNAFENNQAGDLTAEGIETVLEFGRNKYHIWIQSYRYINIFFPIFIVIPYIYSYIEERKNKFNILVMSRYGRCKYIINKFFVISLSGGLILALPEVIYYIGLSIFTRSEILNPFQLYAKGIYADLFTYSPDRYILVIILMHFILGFSFAAFSLGITSFCNKKISVYLVPFGVFLVADIVISSINKISNYSILSTYMCMFSEGYTLNNFIVVNILLIIVGILCIYINERRRIRNG